VPLESISSDATPAQINAWARRMARAHPLALHLASGLTRAVQLPLVKSPMSVCHQWLLIWHSFSEAQWRSEHGIDIAVNEAAHRAMRQVRPQMEEQVARCLALITTNQKALLAKRKSGRAQYNVAEDTYDKLDELLIAEYAMYMPDTIRALIKAQLEYWRLQADMLAKYYT
jgi:hypothetical protein